jgi:hypothetical protein
MTQPLDLALMEHDDGGPYVANPSPSLALGAPPTAAFGLPAPTGSPPMVGVRLDTAGWLALLDRLTWTLPPSRTIWHHTYRPTQDTWAGITTMRAMQRFYAGKGWPAAPHIYSAPDGIWLFNPLDRPGIHANAGNCNLEYQTPVWGRGPLTWWSIGLEMVWDGDRSTPRGPVWEQAVAITGSLSRKLSIPPERLIGFHRDYSPKTCPGTHVTKAAVLAAVNGWLAATAPTPTPLPSTTTPTSTHRVIRETAARERPAPDAPIAWGGRAELPAGLDVELSPTAHPGWLHFAPAGFVPTWAVVPLEAPRPYTPHSGLTVLHPAISAEQAAAWATARGSRYVPFDVRSIAGSVWAWCRVAALDPPIVWAQLTKEASANIDDDPGLEFLASFFAERPRRNGCGYGVTGQIAASPPKGYIRTVGGIQYPTWAQLPDGRWAEGLCFPTWDLSIQAQVGRLLRYLLPADAPTTAEERRLMDFALALRPLDRNAWGSVSQLAHLGAALNPANQGLPRERWVAGWAWPGDRYGQGLADIANTILAQAG